MRVPLSWLQEFVPVEVGAEELSETFADLGFEVDGVEHVGEGLDGIVVARVLETAPHPDADRIQLVQVDRGDGEALQVCCGAFNMSAGDLVPLATVGTTMPNGMEIAARKMRGEMSNGMLCSASEIGLGDDQSGILVLDAALELGTPVQDALGISADVVFDLDVLPNRPDALSILGVARDLAARLDLPLTVPDPQVPEQGPDAAGMADVEIVDPTLCGRFVVRVLSGVTTQDSPAWMAQRLLAAGMRPINGVVDVSNYVMLELGQPNHTYDLAKVAGARLGVRRARPGEQIETLDGVERTLEEADGVIVDGDDVPVGIAGVMGGASTEISADTTDVLLEMAWWDPMAIAATSARHNLHSEASLRFKRGADPEVAEMAARRFAQLLADVCGATLHPGVVDERGDLPSGDPVVVRPDRVNLILGTDLSVGEITELIEPIGFVASELDGQLSVAIPSWRIDSTSEIDVIEEVGRMYGLSRIAKTVPTSPKGGHLSEPQRRRRAIRSAFVGAGLSEAMPMPFLAPGDLERCGLDPGGLKLANPLAAEESVLRTSPRPGLLSSVAYNAARRTTGVRLFEIGRLFGPGELVVDVERSAGLGRVLAGEREFAAAVLAGAEASEAVELLELVLDAAGAGPVVLRAEELAGMHPGRGAVVEVAGVDIGAVGEIDPAVAEACGIDERVALVELDLDHLLAMPESVTTAQPVSRFPSSDVDFAFVVDEVVPAASVATTIRATGGDLVSDVELFDVFRADSLGEGRRSLAYRVRFCAVDRTLTDSEVGELRSSIIDAVEQTHAASLRE
ncbi:MAG: phenylalanine--tRNA ligase subunit beta [Actinomycetia bacterium]|nr:phenylalanine--tRNA ligase subunit beta [Actinomycetes bacterium]